MRKTLMLSALAGALALPACSDDPTESAPEPEPSPEALAEIDLDLGGGTSAIKDSITLALVTTGNEGEATLLSARIAEEDEGSVLRFDDPH